MKNFNELSRRRFLELLLASASFTPGLAAFGGALDNLRGDRVGWARLKTPSPEWLRHSASDPILMQFFRQQTTLNIDPTWYSADVENLAEMCKYPLLFSQAVNMVADDSGRNNIGEYIRRGGFLLIDACCNRLINPNFDVFLQQQADLFAIALPEAKVVPLPSSHEIYRCRFQIPDGRPPHTFYQNIYDPQKAAHGLYGIMIGSRMAGLVSLSGLQCGWDNMVAPAGHNVACMQMLVNIYIYAMMQGG
jgi:hypothetical protein